MTDQPQPDPEHRNIGDEPMTDAEASDRTSLADDGSGSTPRPSQAEGGDEGSVDRPPRPSKPEGEA